MNTVHFFLYEYYFMLNIQDKWKAHRMKLFIFMSVMPPPYTEKFKFLLLAYLTLFSQFTSGRIKLSVKSEEMHSSIISLGEVIWVYKFRFNEDLEKNTSIETYRT